MHIGWKIGLVWLGASLLFGLVWGTIGWVSKIGQEDENGDIWL